MNERVFNREIERLRDTARVERLEVQKVIQLTQEEDTFHSVLDVGTGSGLFAEAFANIGLLVTGIDINEEMLQASAQFVPTGVFQIGSAEKIPYEDKSFDLLFYGLVMHETDDLEQSMKEAKRVARKRISVLEWKYVDEEFGPPLNHRLQAEQIFNAAKKAGFIQMKCTTHTHLALYIIQ